MLKENGKAKEKIIMQKNKYCVCSLNVSLHDLWNHNIKESERLEKGSLVMIKSSTHHSAMGLLPSPEDTPNLVHS